MGTRYGSTALALVLAASAVLAPALRAQEAAPRATVSTVLPHYYPTVPAKGTLEIPITDILADLGDEWASDFHKLQTGAKLVFQPRLSNDIVKQLLTGNASLVIVSRELSSEEKAAFEARFGYAPMRIPLCLDANIILVNKNNPITAISMEQLDAIYSRNRLGGAPAPALVWGDLGVKGELARQTINAYSRSEGTTNRTSFAAQALLKGEYRPGIIDKEDSDSLAEAVSTDLAGIAVGSMSSWYTANKTLPVVPFHGTDARLPTQGTITASRYPMVRIFYAYLNRAPGKALDPSLHEAIQFMLTQEGQTSVANVGLMPGPVEFMLVALKRLRY